MVLQSEADSFNGIIEQADKDGYDRPLIVTMLSENAMEDVSWVVVSDSPVPGQELQELYDSEINFSLTGLGMWAGGFDWELQGDPRIGGHSGTAQDAIKAIKEAAIKHFPGSKFAKKHGSHDSCQKQ